MGTDKKDPSPEVMIGLLESLSKEQFPEKLRAGMVEAIEFRRLLQTESDRGCALMGAAYLDDLLKTRLQS